MDNLLIRIDFDRDDFPVRHTCDGENVSPEIRLERLEAPYLAITMQDGIGPDTMYTHWLIWNIAARDTIPGNIPKVRVVTEPIAAVQGANEWGGIGYTGPCPPIMEVHTYYFNAFGLDAPLDIPPGSPLAVLMEAMKGHVVQYGGQAIATYQRLREPVPEETASRAVSR